jgi:hypothetical protein
LSVSVLTGCSTTRARLAFSPNPLPLNLTIP